MLLLSLALGSAANGLDPNVAQSFNQICGQVASQERMRAAAISGEWVEIEEPTGEMGRFADGQRAYHGGSSLRLRTFRRAFGRENYYLVISRIGLSPALNECRIFDLSPPRTLSADEIENWLGIEVAWGTTEDNEYTAVMRSPDGMDNFIVSYRRRPSPQCDQSGQICFADYSPAAVELYATYLEEPK